MRATGRLAFLPPLAAVTTALLAACSGHPLTATPSPPWPTSPLPRQAFTAPTNREVDVLFVVDTAPNSQQARTRLGAGIAGFVDGLRGGHPTLPNLRVAVISSDLGAGALSPTDSRGCTPGGDGAVFHAGVRGPCTSPLIVGRRFLELDGDRATSTSGNPDADVNAVASALACVVPLAQGGCPFAQPLGAALRALGADGAPPPSENVGFLRPDAFLALVLVTAGDDCSAPADSPVWDATSRLAADPLGAITTFRCAEQGLLCGGAPPPRTKASMLEGCASAEDGKLLRVSEAVSRLKALKTNRNSVLVGAIISPATPVSVGLGAPGSEDDPTPWPFVEPACRSGDGATAAPPAVRLEQWAYTFGHNGTLGDVCADDFAPPLGEIAKTIAGVLGPACLEARVANVRGPRGVRPDCTVTWYRSGAGDAGTTATTVPACADLTTAAPCWRLAPDAACPAGTRLAFEGGGDPALARESAVECAVCANASDPRCR